jgi:hypothetical protein
MSHRRSAPNRSHACHWDPVCLPIVRVRIVASTSRASTGRSMSLPGRHTRRQLRIPETRTWQGPSCTECPDLLVSSRPGIGAPDDTYRRECARSPRPHVSLSVTAGRVRTHRAAGPHRPAPPRRSRASGRRPEPRPTRRFRAGVRLPAPDRPGSACTRPTARPSPEPGPRARRHPVAPRPGPRSPPAP